MSFYRQSRDANEPAVIAALIAIGASVTKLPGGGLPDLLVSYRGVLHLLEVKNLDSSTHAKKTTRRGIPDPTAYLTKAQRKWWLAWTGKPPVIVTTAAEALAAVTGLTATTQQPELSGGAQ